MADAFGSDTSLLTESIDGGAGRRPKTRKIMHICAVCFLILIGAIIVVIFISGDSSSSGESTPAPTGTWLLYSSHIDVEKIEKVSKFRSSIGPDYSEPAAPNDTCSSMMHWFVPHNGYTMEELDIYSPLDGEIRFIVPENENDNSSGYHIMIKADAQFGIFYIYLWHVTPININQGDNVTSHQKLGHHASSNYFSGISINNANARDGDGLLDSIFDGMDPDTFLIYQKWNITNRKQPIINKTERAKYPLECPQGEDGPITNNSNAMEIDNWVFLNTTNPTKNTKKN